MNTEFYGDERDFEPGGIYYDGGPVDFLEDDEEVGFDDGTEDA